MKSLLILLWLCLWSQVMLAQEVLKMLNKKHQPVVKGKVNGRSAYFLVDTGSQITILNLKDTSRLNIKSNREGSKSYRIHGLIAEDRGQFLFSERVEIQIGDTKIEDGYMILDLTRIVNTIARNTGVKINGIIGSDLMDEYNFVIDYKTRKVSFTPK